MPIKTDQTNKTNQGSSLVYALVAQSENIEIGREFGRKSNRRHCAVLRPVVLAGCSAALLVAATTYVYLTSQQEQSTNDYPGNTEPTTAVAIYDSKKILHNNASAGVGQIFFTAVTCLAISVLTKMMADRAENYQRILTIDLGGQIIQIDSQKLEKAITQTKCKLLLNRSILIDYINEILSGLCADTDYKRGLCPNTGYKKKRGSYINKNIAEYAALMIFQKVAEELSKKFAALKDEDKTKSMANKLLLGILHDEVKKFLKEDFKQMQLEIIGKIYSFVEKTKNNLQNSTKNVDTLHDMVVKAKAEFQQKQCGETAAQNDQINPFPTNQTEVLINSMMTKCGTDNQNKSCTENKQRAIQHFANFVSYPSIFNLLHAKVSMGKGVEGIKGDEKWHKVIAQLSLEMKEAIQKFLINTENKCIFKLPPKELKKLEEILKTLPRHAAKKEGLNIREQSDLEGWAYPLDIVRFYIMRLRQLNDICCAVLDADVSQSAESDNDDDNALYNAFDDAIYLTRDIISTNDIDDLLKAFNEGIQNLGLPAMSEKDQQMIKTEIETSVFGIVFAAIRNGKTPSELSQELYELIRTALLRAGKAPGFLPDVKCEFMDVLLNGTVQPTEFCQSPNQDSLSTNQGSLLKRITENLTETITETIARNISAIEAERQFGVKDPYEEVTWIDKYGNTAQPPAKTAKTVVTSETGPSSVISSETRTANATRTANETQSIFGRT